MNPEDIFEILISHSGDIPWKVDASVDAKKTFKHAVFGYLVNVNDSLIVEPGLLSSWDWDYSTDKYIFKISKELRFHNGRRVTAKDVEFSLVRWHLTPHPSFEKSYVPNIAGIENIKQGDKFKSGAVKGIEIVNDTTLAISLKKYSPTFLHTLIDVPLVPIEELEDDYYHWKSLPVGAGAYKLVSFDEKRSKGNLELFKKDLDSPQKVHFWTKPAEGVEYDIATVNPKNLAGYKEHIIPNSYDNIGHFLFNFDSELGSDINFRKSLRYGLDKIAISRVRNTHAMPLNEIIPPTFAGSTPYQNEFDLKKAKEYFDKVPASLRSKSYKIPAFLVSKRPFDQELEDQINRIGYKFELVGGWTKFTAPDNPPIKPTVINVSSPDPLLQYSFFLEGSPFTGHFPTDNDELFKMYGRVAESKSLDVRILSLQKLSDYFRNKVISLPNFGIPPVIYVKKGSRYSIGHQRSAISFFLDRVSYK